MPPPLSLRRGDTNPAMALEFQDILSSLKEKGPTACAANILNYAASIMAAESEWSMFLDHDLKTNLDKCLRIVQDKKTRDTILRCVKNQEYHDLFNQECFLRKPQVDSYVAKKLMFLKNAFHSEYRGDRSALLHFLQSRQTTQHVFSIVQSAGMGKSRLVEESRKLCISIPISLRWRLPSHPHTYPPADDVLVKYLCYHLHYIESQDSAEIKHAAFMEALFDKVGDKICELDVICEHKSGDLVREWYDWLNEGGTDLRMGPNRCDLYRTVRRASYMTHVDAEHIPCKQRLNLEGDWKISLSKAANRFIDKLKKCHYFRRNAENLRVVISFDECGSLLPLIEDRKPDQILALQTVLQMFNDTLDLPIFFIFLSTDFRVIHSKFAPQIVHLAGASGVKIMKEVALRNLIELPLDIYRDSMNNAIGSTNNSSIKDGLTLKDISLVGNAVSFGRPLWNAVYYGSGRNSKLVQDLAIETLQRNQLGLSANENLAELAAFDIRVLFTQDSRIIYYPHPLTLDIQKIQIKLNMLLLFDSTTEADPRFQVGYWSEPILANAAAMIQIDPELNPGGLKWNAPRLLSKAFNCDLSKLGDRAELFTRTLLTVAHDDVVVARRKSKPSDNNSDLEDSLEFEQPVLLIEVLQHLLHEDVWNKVRLAKPTSGANGQTVESAFSNTYVNFTHWARIAPLSDNESIDANLTATLITRGAAIRCPEDQEYDLGIPVLHGGHDVRPTLHNVNICKIIVERIIKSDSEYICNEYNGMDISGQCVLDEPESEAKIHGVQDMLPELTLRLHWKIQTYACIPNDEECEDES